MSMHGEKGRAIMGGINGILFLLGLSVLCTVAKGQLYAATSPTNGMATFYGGEDASGTMGGACGYGNLYSQGYGTNTAALSNILFNDGLTCGACFRLTCRTSETNWCYPGRSLIVTATNNCPQGSYGGWCDWPKPHFDLAYPAFTQLARSVGGVVPIQFTRVPCDKKGGIRFLLGGNPWYLSTVMLNVAGAGDITAAWVRGYNDFQRMDHNWGQVWTQGSSLGGQTLSFKLTCGDADFDKTWEFWNAAPDNWRTGQTYEMDWNFNW